MISSFLFSLVAGWWNFSHRDFVITRQEQSKTNPIITLFIGETGHDEADLFREYILSCPDVTTTVVNCSESEFCNIVSISPPLFVIIRGPFSRYWTRTREMSSEIWTKLIEVELSDAVVRLTEHEKVFELVDRRKNYGGSFFHLVVLNESLAVFRTFRSWAKYYRIFNCTCSYSVEDTPAPVLAVFLARNAKRARRVRPIEIEAFMTQHRFSYAHEYDLTELLELSERESLIFWLNDGLSENPLLMPGAIEIDFFRYGVMRREDAKTIFPGAQPRFFGFHRVSNCLGVLNDSNRLKEFAENLTEGSNCVYSPLFGRYGRSSSKAMEVLLAIFCGCVFLGIAYLGFARKIKQA
jgi:hypothetical protein